jgi:hypothetical protein
VKFADPGKDTAAIVGIKLRFIAQSARELIPCLIAKVLLRNSKGRRGEGKRGRKSFFDP